MAVVSSLCCNVLCLAKCTEIITENPADEIDHEGNDNSISHVCVPQIKFAKRVWRLTSYDRNR